MTLAEAKVLSNALTQYIDNSEDPWSDDVLVDDIKLAQALLDKADAIIAGINQ